MEDAEKLMRDLIIARLEVKLHEYSRKNSQYNRETISAVAEKAAPLFDLDGKAGVIHRNKVDLVDDWMDSPEAPSWAFHKPVEQPKTTGLTPEQKKNMTAAQKLDYANARFAEQRRAKGKGQ